MSILLTVFSHVPFYLIGCLPAGYLIGKRYGIDVRQHGSGNVGATNVGRVVGRKAGLLTLGLDAGKGLLAVVLARLLAGSDDYPGYAALAVVAGHCFSLPRLLPGGKGVATSLGALLALQPLSAVFAAGVFTITFAASQIVSLSSVTAALLVPLFGFFAGIPEAHLLSTAAISLLVVFRHKANLKRLIEGKEKPIELSGKK